MSARFHVFHVDGERGLRGGERQLLYLACALRAREHANTVVCREGSPLARQAAALGLETRFLPFWFELDPLSAARLRSLASGAERPILHAHTAHAAGIAALASKPGLPFVSHRRVDFPLCGGWSRRLKYERAGRVVAVSRAIAGILVDAGLADEQVVVVADALPVGEERAWVAGDGAFAPPATAERAALRRALAEEFGLDEHAFWIGNLAALVPHKDHDTLLAAALVVLISRPQARFLLAGEGPEGERLQERARRMGLLGRVVFLGQRSAPELLKALDAFALSSWGEGMGSVLLEAAACGVPIAATAAGGIPEVIEDGVSGLLCPPRDPEALAERLTRVIDDEPLRRRLAAAGLERLPRFGLSRMAAQMEQVYASLA